MVGLIGAPFLLISPYLHLLSRGLPSLSASTRKSSCFSATRLGKTPSADNDPSLADSCFKRRRETNGILMELITEWPQHGRLSSRWVDPEHQQLVCSRCLKPFLTRPRQSRGNLLRLPACPQKRTFSITRSLKRKWQRRPWLPLL